MVSLSKEAKTFVNTLPDKHKSIIFDLQGDSDTPRNPVQKGNEHNTFLDDDNGEDTSDTLEMEDTKPEDSTLLMNIASRNTKVSPSDIRDVLSSSDMHSSNTPREAIISIVHSVAQPSITSSRSSLVDRPRNGGFAGFDVQVIDKRTQTVNVREIDNHEVNNFPHKYCGKCD